MRKWTDATSGGTFNQKRYQHMLQNFLIEFPQLTTQDTRRHFTDEQRIIIFEKAKGRCQWIEDSGHECGHQFSWQDDWEADHIIPHSEGGLTTIENGRVLCQYRNRANNRGRKTCPFREKELAGS